MLVRTILVLSLKEDIDAIFVGEGYTLLRDNRHEYGVGNH